MKAGSVKMESWKGRVRGCKHGAHARAREERERERLREKRESEMGDAPKAMSSEIHVLYAESELPGW